MFWYFFSFEVRYWLRSWMLWIFFAVIALLIFGAVATDQVVVGGALENTLRNAPYVIENFYSFVCLLALLMTTAFVNSAASRDFAFNTSEMLFSTPLRKSSFLLGRFLGSALISVIPLLGVSAGIIAAKYMPWVEAERWGPIIWTAHLKGILVFAVPNTLFIAAIVFAIAVLSRSTVISFVGSLVLLAGYGVAQALTTDIKNETLAALIDPFGVNTYQLATKYWTVADKNHLTIGYTGLLLWNRLIWLGVGALIFGFAYWRFSFSERRRAGKRARVEENGKVVAVAIPQAGLSFDAHAHWQQFLSSTWLEFKGLVKSTVFIVIALAAVLNTVPSLIFNATEGFGDVSLPVTYNILEIIAGSLYVFLMAMITYYAGVLIWQERDTRTDEIHDALPHPEWPLYASKLVALVASIALIQAIVMVAGIISPARSSLSPAATRTLHRDHVRYRFHHLRVLCRAGILHPRHLA